MHCAFIPPPKLLVVSTYDDGTSMLAFASPALKENIYLYRTRNEVKLLAGTHVYLFHAFPIQSTPPACSPTVAYACMCASPPSILVLQVIQNLQAFLVSAGRNRTATGSGTARWSRLRTAWDNKTALSILLAEAVKAKVIG